jgi:hypothetical protein
MGKFRVALVLHVAFSLFMFSNSNILSAKNLAYLQWVQDELAQYEKYLPLEAEHFLSRWTGGVGLLYLLFVLWLVVFWLLYSFSFTVLSTVFHAIVYILCCGG